jgi:glycosyltransferase involved in cell wall biosynthesis
MAQRIAIITQDPINRGGVLRLVRYIYEQILANGDEPTVLHYASFKRWPGLSASLLNPARGKVVVKPRKKRYDFEGMSAVAIGTSFPEFEPNRLSTNQLWHGEIKKHDRFILVTGSAHTGFMLAQEGVRFTAWVSSIVEDDRKERLKRQKSLPARIEKTMLGAIKTKELGVLRSASRILTVSEDTSASISRLEPTLATEVWPFPVDTDLFTPDPSVEVHPYLAFVGRANDPRKDLRLFLRALLHVREIMPNVSADIVSREPAWYRREEEWRTLAGNVRFNHTISDQELVDIYRRSTAMMITSQQEGLSIAALEAMACGTPVISTRCGGPEMFIRDGENGYLGESDGDDLGQKALYLLEDKLARDSMSVKARETVEQGYSREHWDSKFRSLLKDL